jgi:puromycin-sensitive aminopeptidase
MALLDERDDHRLPRNVSPERYEIDLRCDIDAGTFRGSVDTELRIETPTTQIHLHADLLTIDAVLLDGTPVAGYRLDVERQRLIVDLHAELPAATTATLRCEFRGQLSDDLVGFYRSTYTEDDGPRTIACTQFEAPYARRAFPCWDEPDRKARFAVTLEIPPGNEAFSNGTETARTATADGWTRIAFSETMPMSTYLVAFVIGPLVATPVEMMSGVPVRIVARPGREAQCGFALKITRHALAWFEDYYGIAYPADSLDLIAIPDFAFGAMENLGCITFREILLLVDESTATANDLKGVALVTAHELAHMWFGDLVTMDWWTGIWLNEAFATFMEISCVDAFRPDWDVWGDFGSSKGQAFEVDSLAATRPIEYECRTPEDAEGMFDVLTYEKGCAVLRMLEQYIGPDEFRSGVRQYLQRHAYGNTVTTDLWDALESATDGPVRQIMNGWILQGGYPLVHVDRVAAGVRLRQERLVFSGGDAAEEHSWDVPLQVTIDDVTQRVLLGAQAQDLPAVADAAVQANTGALGFYRVHPDESVLTAVLARTATADPVEVFAVLDDQVALLSTEHGSIDQVVAALRASAGCPAPAVWRRILSAAEMLRRLAGHDTEPLADLARELAVEQLSAPDPEVSALARRLAGILGNDVTLVAAARDTLDARDPGATQPELLAADIDIAASAGDLELFTRFESAMSAATNPQDEARYRQALTKFRDPAAHARFLELARTTLRTQDAPYDLAAAMFNPTRGPETWRWVAAHWDELTERFPKNSHVRMVRGVTSFFDPDVCADVLAFFTTHDIPSGAVTLRQHLELVKVHRACRERFGGHPLLKE